MRSRTAVLAAVLAIAPLGAQAADLVVWWEKGFYAEEDEALKEIIAAFEQGTGNQVELVSYPVDELPGKIMAAVEAGRPPDFAHGVLLSSYLPRWALEGRLADLSETMGPFSNLFDPYQLDRAVLLNATTNQKDLYGLPIGHANQPPLRLEEPLGAGGFHAR